MDNVTVATITSIPLIFDAMPLEQFIVVVTLCAIFLLGLTLNLVAVTSIITRSPHQQVDVIDTYVLNACLAYLWMLLFSLLPYLVKYIAQTPNLLGFVASKFVFFLSRYPLYVLATLITAMAVHACWAGSQSGRHCYYRPAEWRSLLAVCVAWVSGLIAVIELFWTPSRAIYAVIVWFLPFLSVFIIFPLAFCCGARAGTTHKKNKDMEDGFPIYRLGKSIQPSFTMGHITLAFFIGLIHWCCLTPIIVAGVIGPVDGTVMGGTEDFDQWSSYFECVRYGPTFLVPMVYIIVLYASKKSTEK